MLKKYKPFLRAGAIDTMAYRFNILMWALITVFEVACLVFLWLAVYRSSAGGMDAEIHGFTYREMISYVVLTTVFGFSPSTTTLCGTSTTTSEKARSATTSSNPSATAGNLPRPASAACSR